MFTSRGTAVPLFGLFDNFQVWKLHTPMDYFFFFLTIAIGVAVFYGMTQILKKYRTPEHAVQRVAKKLKKLGGNDAATYIGKTIRCGTESEPSELIALTADRIYLIHVFHYGTKAYGGVNQREWVLESGTERRKEMNPLPALKDQRSMLQKLFTREKAGSVPMELLLVFSDTYGRTRFQLDGVTNALDIRDMNSWWKKRPARFSGRLDFAKVKQILDRSLA